MPIAYNPDAPSAATLPCPVALSLSREFTNYVHVTPQVPFVRDQYSAPFGPALQNYAVYVAQSVFGDVQVLEGQPPRKDAVLLLVPSVSGSALTPAFSRVAVASGTLGVHWDVEDPKTGKVLCSVGAQSEASHPTKGGGFLQHFPEVVHDLMTNLTAVTIQRFNASKDIQRLSGH